MMTRGAVITRCIGSRNAIRRPSPMRLWIGARSSSDTAGRSRLRTPFTLIAATTNEIASGHHGDRSGEDFDQAPARPGPTTPVAEFDTVSLLFASTSRSLVNHRREERVPGRLPESSEDPEDQ